MKKTFLALLVLSILLLNNNPTITYASIQTPAPSYNDESIDTLFHELNHAYAKKQQHSVNSALNLSSNQSDLSYEITLIEQKLEQKGVHKIDKNSASDIQLLLETMASSQYKNGIKRASASVYDNAPDLNAITALYQIYYTDSTVTYKGFTIPYRHITLVDEGNGNMQLSQIIKTCDKTSKPLIVEDLANYVFKYGTSQFFGRLGVAGVFADFTLGAFLSAYDSAAPITISSDKNLITTTFEAITSMRYTYVYNEGSWRLIATSASSDCAKRIDFCGNIKGKAVISTLYDTNFVVNSQETSPYYIVRRYIESYARTGNPDNYQCYPLGQVDLPVYKKRSVTIVYPFAEMPSYL